LLASAKAGERDAFAELVRRYLPIAHRTAVLLGAGSEADDVVQEAFVKAYRGLAGFRVGSPFRPWLLRIVANETKNLHRSVARRRIRESTPADPTELFPHLSMTADPADRVVDREQAVLRAELLRLPDNHRAVLIYRYLLDLDEAETAAVLGIAPGTVKSRTHRALHKLRGNLDTPIQTKTAGVDKP
jgi:RNA polymerase sigma factor (sigma-70 family)